MDSGCVDAPQCESVLEDAAARQSSLVDAVFDAGLVNEEEFARLLAKEAALEFMASSEEDLEESLHRKFPAKLALRYLSLIHI